MTAPALRRLSQVHALLLIGAAAVAGAACEFSEDGCAFAIAGVAGDGADNVFLVGSKRRDDEAPLIVVKRSSFGDTAWKTPLSVFDGTPVELAVPAAGGVIALGSGAAATRIDDAGELAWVIGYPMTAATRGTLTSDDRVVLADPAAVRAFERDGSAAWALALPENVEAIGAIAADATGGAWLLGSFSGNAFPLLFSGPGSGTTAGSFLIHLNRDGQVQGGRAWQAAITLTQLTGGDPLVARGTAINAAVPDFGVPAPTSSADADVVIAFGPTAQVFWARRAHVPVLIRDGQGDLMTVAVENPLQQDVIEFRVARWDGGGVETARSMFTIPKEPIGVVEWLVGPAGGGLVIGATHENYATCELDPSVLLRVRADLSFEQLEVMLP